MRTAWGLLLIAFVALALALPRLLAPPRSSQPVGAPGEGPVAGAPERAGDRAIAEAFRERRSGLWVESGGMVERLLPDDRKGSRHQRFILRLEDGSTLLVAHNIDLAPRVPLRPGDRVRFRGQYEWNDRGGVIHWTHHDPGGGAGGWIERDGSTYR